MGPGVRSHVFVGATYLNLVVNVFEILKLFKGTNNILDLRQKSNEMNRVLGHLCAHIG